MRNRLMLPMGLVMLIVGSTAPVSAQVAPPPPPPQTGPGFAEHYLPGSDSFHFRTVEGLGGYGFKEGEQVTVTAVPPVIWSLPRRGSIAPSDSGAGARRADRACHG